MTTFTNKSFRKTAIVVALSLSFVNTLNLPEKPLLIITAVMIITVVAGIFIRKY